MEERLQKVLAKAGVASRRHSEEMILAGRVGVNGQVVNQLGIKVDPNLDSITVDGRPLPESQGKIYVLLNKPRGYVTTLSDPQNRRIVTDLVTGIEGRIFPVGRLDYDTEGLLLLTNDGDLTFALTHPKHEVEKTYLAKVKGTPNSASLKSFRRGLQLEDGMTAPAEVQIVEREGNNATLEIRIHEGRNRQVRRMCAAIGHPVLHLRRVRFGFLDLTGIMIGAYRQLTTTEVNRLKDIAGIVQKNQK